jgi:hypothetical protein
MTNGLAYFSEMELYGQKVCEIGAQEEGNNNTFSLAKKVIILWESLEVGRMSDFAETFYHHYRIIL